MMRVIAGTARGKNLAALPGEDVTRPTINRVKEAMFSSVQFSVPGARVLDLFAGSGQLGIEALSLSLIHISWWKSADFCHPALCRFARRVLFICCRFCAIYSRRFPLCKTICPPAKLFPPTVSAAK